MKKLVWLAALLIAVGSFQSCEKEPAIEEPEGLTAPEIPPLAMFTMPTDEFDETKLDTFNSSAVDFRGMGPDSYQNWIHAALNLAFWNGVIHLQMAVPTAAFVAAVHTEPQYIGGLTFEWSYPYEAPAGLGGHTYYVSLKGQYAPGFEQVLWTMTVSQEGGFSDFVWYTGISSATEDKGEFTLNRFPNNPQPYLRLDYMGDETTGQGMLRFTNIAPGGDNFGHYIEYREMPGEIYDRAFDVQQGPGNFLEIQWNEESSEGRVRHPFHFDDGEWYCWDASFVDVECE